MSEFGDILKENLVETVIHKNCVLKCAFYFYCV